MVAAAHGRGDQEQESLELINLSETKVSDLGSGRGERRDGVWRKENEKDGRKGGPSDGGKREKKKKTKKKEQEKKL